MTTIDIVSAVAVVCAGMTVGLRRWLTKRHARRIVEATKAHEAHEEATGLRYAKHQREKAIAQRLEQLRHRGR